VTPLSASVNDVLHMEQFLQKTFDRRLQLVKLLNKQATRQNFIDNFISHLIDNANIQPGDIVLFFYSGHGSYTSSLPELAGADNLDQDETLVLYDSRCPGNFDLADKELRLLISRIPAHADIVIITDACHSGSITRAEAPVIPPRAKLAPRGHGRKSLSDYLTIHGYGLEQLRNAHGKIVFPESTYLALAACGRKELAYESPAGDEGVFTGRLMELLQAASGRLTYRELFEHLHTSLKRWDNQQTPQLKAYNGFEENKFFLSDEVGKTEAKYTVVQQLDGTYTINAGALHGLSNSPETIGSTTIKIYKTPNIEGPFKSARLDAVGLDISQLQDPGLGNKIYPAAITGLPPALAMRVTGAQQQIDAWREEVEHDPIPAIAFTYESNTPYDFEIQIEPTRILLLQKEDTALIHGVTGGGKESIQYMLRCCRQISLWQNLLTLHNYATTEENDDTGIQFGIRLQHQADGDWVLSRSRELTLHIGGPTREIPFRLHLENASDQAWYCGVFWLGSRYGIKRVTGDMDESALVKGQTLKSLDMEKKFRLNDGGPDLDRYRLIASRTPFKDWLVPDRKSLQPGIVPYSKTRSADPAGKTPKGLHTDWYTSLLSIRTQPGPEDPGIYVRDQPPRQ